MGSMKNFVTPLHQATVRDYLERMNNDKVHCMTVAEKYGWDYWDGERKYGYGGYRFIEGRWKPVAQKLIETYDLGPTSSVLDVGCGKAYLLHEIKSLIPDITIVGIDISQHGIDNATEKTRNNLMLHDARTPLPFETNQFNLTISLGTLHNFRLPELAITIAEIDRVGQNGYVMVESYRNNLELFNLQCWALTAKSFLDPEEWEWFFTLHGYHKDYEFIFFE